MWGSTFQVEGIVSAKVLRQEQTWCVPGNEVGSFAYDSRYLGNIEMQVHRVIFLSPCAGGSGRCLTVLHLCLRSY